MKRIDHFGPGAFGDYRGHSTVHEHGEVEHFEKDGDVSPFEKFVGRSKVDSSESRSGTGGGSGLDFPAGLGLIFVPFFLALGIAALFICPALWLLWKLLRKRPRKAEVDDDSFVGAGWVILAFFMLPIGFGLGMLSLSCFAVIVSPTDWRSFGMQGVLLGLLVGSWSLSLLIGAFNLFRHNWGEKFWSTVAVLIVLWASGMALSAFYPYPD